MTPGPSCAGRCPCPRPRAGACEVCRSVRIDEAAMRAHPEFRGIGNPAIPGNSGGLRNETTIIGLSGGAWCALAGWTSMMRHISKTPISPPGLPGQRPACAHRPVRRQATTRRQARRQPRAGYLGWQRGLCEHRVHPAQRHLRRASLLLLPVRQYGRGHLGRHRQFQPGEPGRTARAGGNIRRLADPEHRSGLMGRLAGERPGGAVLLRHAGPAISPWISRSTPVRSTSSGTNNYTGGSWNAQAPTSLGCY